MLGNAVKEAIKTSEGDLGPNSGNQWNGITVENLSASLGDGQINGSNYLSITHKDQSSSLHVRGLVPIIEEINRQAQGAAAKPPLEKNVLAAQGKVDQAGELCHKIAVKLQDNDKKKNFFSKFMERCYNKVVYGEYKTSAAFVIREMTPQIEKLAEVKGSLDLLAEGFSAVRNKRGDSSDKESLSIAASTTVSDKGAAGKAIKSFWGSIFKS